MADEVFVSSVKAEDYDAALNGGLKFFRGEFVSEEQKEALRGPAGGYYIPKVSHPDDNVWEFSFTGSVPGMPSIGFGFLTNQPLDGATPVKGQDYWTPEDQQAIVSDVLAALPTYRGEVENA